MTSLHTCAKKRNTPLIEVLMIASLFGVTGCATAYQPAPLSTQHPAHPEAMAAPQQPQSQTLAYGPADLPAPPPAMQMAQGGMPGAHGTHGAHAMPGQPGAPPAMPEGQYTVVGEGTVIAVVPSSNQIVLDHKAIAGFMDAMTMGYQVNPPALAASVQAGDTVRFTLDTQQRAIVNLEKMP